MGIRVFPTAPLPAGQRYSFSQEPQKARSASSSSLAISPSSYQKSEMIVLTRVWNHPIPYTPATSPTGISQRLMVAA